MASGNGQSRLVASFAAVVVTFAVMMPCKSGAADDKTLWSVYE